MRCKAWVVVKQVRKKGSGEPKEKVTAVADAYDREDWDPSPPPMRPPLKGFQDRLNEWYKTRRQIRNVSHPVPPSLYPDAVRCGGEIVASVRVYEEPVMGGTSATLEVEFLCKRCGHTYHGVDVDALRYADGIATLLTKHIARLPDMVYNPDYGDDKLCKCGHPYYRHFDSYEDMEPVGCKYCDCHYFEEA